MSAPSFLSSTTVVLILSDSLTRSSAASLISVSPSACVAARAISGISSMTLGIVSPLTDTPVRLLLSTEMSATGSAPADACSSIVTLAPMDFNTLSMPMRPGFTPTFRSRMLASGWMAPRHQPGRCRARVPRHIDLQAIQWPRSDAYAVAVHRDVCAHCSEHPLGVVPRSRGLVYDGAPIRPQPRQQHCRFNLGAGHRQCVVNPPQAHHHESPGAGTRSPSRP